jgi:hypothetical protein
VLVCWCVDVDGVFDLFFGVNCWCGFLQFVVLSEVADVGAPRRVVKRNLIDAEDSVFQVKVAIVVAIVELDNSISDWRIVIRVSQSVRYGQ